MVYESALDLPAWDVMLEPLGSRIQRIKTNSHVMRKLDPLRKTAARDAFARLPDVGGLRTDSTLETDIHVRANVQKAARNPGEADLRRGTHGGDGNVLTIAARYRVCAPRCRVSKG
jgi:hypothetical protein